MNKHITNRIISIGLKYKNVINRSPVLKAVAKKLYYRFAFGTKSVSKPSTSNKYAANSEYSMLSHSAKQIFETMKEEMKHDKINNYPIKLLRHVIYRKP